MAAMINVLLIVAVTIPPREGVPTNPCGFLSIRCGERVTLDIILNVLLFIPLGICLAVAGATRSLAVVAALSLSGLVESLQLVLPGRYPALRDLIANGAGGALGAGVASVVPILRHRPAAIGRWISIGWPLVLGGLLTGGGLLLEPSAPDQLWFGQWAPELGNFEHFRGIVVRAQLNGVELPSGPFPTTAEFKERYSSVEVQARAIPPSSASRRLAPIVSVFDDAQREVFILGQQGRDLVFEPRLRAEDWGLRSLAIRARGGLPAIRDTLGLEGNYDRGRLRVASRWDAPNGLITATQHLTPVSSWRVLLPWRWPLTPPVATGLDSLLLGLLAFPLGLGVRFASGSGRKRDLAPAALLSLACAVAALIPLPFGLEVAKWPLWLGFAGGATLGYGTADEAARATTHQLPQRAYDIPGPPQ